MTVSDYSPDDKRAEGSRGIAGSFSRAQSFVKEIVTCNYLGKTLCQGLLLLQHHVCLSSITFPTLFEAPLDRSCGLTPNPWG